jgi:hypothetical protein
LHSTSDTQQRCSSVTLYFAKERDFEGREFHPFTGKLNMQIDGNWKSKQLFSKLNHYENVSPAHDPRLKAQLESAEQSLNTARELRMNPLIKGTKSEDELNRVIVKGEALTKTFENTLLINTGKTATLFECDPTTTFLTTVTIYPYRDQIKSVTNVTNVATATVSGQVSLRMKSGHVVTCRGIDVCINVDGPWRSEVLALRSRQNPANSVGYNALLLAVQMYQILLDNASYFRYRTKTDIDGNYVFHNIKPNKNYVIIASYSYSNGSGIWMSPITLSEGENLIKDLDTESAWNAATW